MVLCSAAMVSLHRARATAPSPAEKPRSSVKASTPSRVRTTIARLSIIPDRRNHHEVDLRRTAVQLREDHPNVSSLIEVTLETSNVGGWT